MTWDDTKVDDVDELPAAEYNAMVAYIKRAVVSKNGAYTAVNKEVVLVDASGGGVTINLPASPNDGDFIDIKKTDSSSNTVTISGNGNNVDGVANVYLYVQYESICIVSDGSNWFII
jgi:hypothetical protein